MSAASPAAITVAICTYDRHHLLQDAVDALLKQRIDRDLFQILIVDNSPDKARADAFFATADFVADVTIVRSEPPGLSRARNHAAAVCSTPYIAYIDDDARPEPDWLGGLLAGFRHAPNVGAVGGPILPLWKGSPPGWLPVKHIALLTVLRPTEDDHDLPKHQYLYGANMAFGVKRLIEMGGFPEQIGRDGAKSLLSCEETQVQDSLRDTGYSVRFVNAARVHHMVHEDRLRRNWMRSRMAWQSASEQLQKPPVFHKDWVLDEIAQLARRNPDAAAALRLFFGEAEGHALDAQLDAIRHFSTLLLGAHLMQEQSVRLQPAPPETGRSAGFAGGDAHAGVGGYSPISAGASLAKYLFVEAQPGHQYLYDLYGDMESTHLQLYSTDDSAWCKDERYRAHFKAFLDSLRRSIARRTQAIFFLTFDGPVYGSGKHEFFDFLQSCPVPVLGILHRLPEGSAAVETVKTLERLAAGICFMSEVMAERAAAEHGLAKALYLPHHPTSYAFPDAFRYREQTRARLGVRPDQVVLSVIGEARNGKGIPWLLSSLGHIPPAIRERMFFLFAGKATSHSNAEVREALAGSGACGFSDLRPHPVPSNYAVLTGSEYASYIAATDIGLLLYQERQRHCMSGVLGDFLAANCKVVATADSVIGAEVGRHDLGIAVAREDAEALSAALVEAVTSASAPFSQRAEAYRRQIAPDAVLAALQRHIECGARRTSPAVRWHASEAAE